MPCALWIFSLDSEQSLHRPVSSCCRIHSHRFPISSVKGALVVNKEHLLCQVLCNLAIPEKLSQFHFHLSIMYTHTAGVYTQVQMGWDKVSCITPQTNKSHICLRELFKLSLDTSHSLNRVTRIRFHIQYIVDPMNHWLSNLTTCR